jgi:hypothetical protein
MDGGLSSDIVTASTTAYGHVVNGIRLAHLDSHALVCLAGIPARAREVVVTVRSQRSPTSGEHALRKIGIVSNTPGPFVGSLVSARCFLHPMTYIYVPV